MKVTFTLHAKIQVKKRNLTEQEVTESIKNPDKIIKKHGKLYFQKNLGRGTIEIVGEAIENNIKVITIYWI
mgnify:CR=1 FL=1